jgi:hypothetical protein
MLEEDLAQCRHSKVFVDVLGECGSYHKEIGELSQAEIRTLEPGLRIRVVNRLLERYVAEQVHNDLLVGRHPQAKDRRDIAPGSFRSADVVCKGTGVAQSTAC